MYSGALVDHHQADVTGAARQAELELGHRLVDLVLRRVERPQAAVRLAVRAVDRENRLPDPLGLRVIRNSEVEVAQQPARRGVLRMARDVRGQPVDRTLRIARGDLRARRVEHGRIRRVHAGKDDRRLRGEHRHGLCHDESGRNGEQTQQTHEDAPSGG